MVTVIYVDVLIAVNIFVTYILLVCTRVILKQDTSKWGIAFAALLGGASSLVIFWETMPVVASVAYKIAVALVISFLAFLPKSKKMLFKTTLAFFLVNFIFGGVMYFVEISFHVNDVMYINGTVYFDVSLLFLVSMTLICYGLLLVGDYFLKRRASASTVYEVQIFYRNGSVSVKALYDTGNHLADGLTGKTVNVIELNAMAPLFSAEEYEFFEKSSITSAVPESLKKELRIVPCSGVTGNGVMKGIAPQRLVIKNKDIEIEVTETILAICNKSLAENEYTCILNAEIFERGKRINDKKVKR